MQEHVSCQLDGRESGKYYRLTFYRLQGYLISRAAAITHPVGRLPKILGPAIDFSGELITIMSTLVMAALLAASWRSELPRPTQVLLVGLTAGAFLVTTLLTPRSIFFIPLVFFLSHCDESSPGASKRKWDFPAYSIFLATFGLGVLISWLRAPSTTMAQFANILQPLMGSRWLANFFWLATVSILSTIVRPWKPLPLLRYAGLNSPAGVALLFWANTLAISVVYRLTLSGMESFTQYLLFSCGPMLALAALLFSVSTSKFRAFFWVLLAIISGMGSWLMTRPEDRIITSSDFGGLELALDLVHEEDLLLVHSDGFVVWEFWIPVDLAGKGLIQTFDDPAVLKSLFREKEIAANHRTVWVLLYGESKTPWLKPYRSPAGNLVIVGKAGSNFMLHQFKPEYLPLPVTVFSDLGKGGSMTESRGLNKDGVWTEKTVSLIFDFSGISAEFLDITLKGWRPDKAGPANQGLQVHLNGTQLDVLLTEKSMLRFSVPPELLLLQGNILEIETPTFIPSKLDQTSSDSRALGLDLHDIVLR